MDYEKAYKEALERAKDIKNVPCPRDESISTADYIFPELRESEDERIRKALIDGVRQIRCKNGITQEQMVAYLEKQKVQWSEEDEKRYNDLFWILYHSKELSQIGLSTGKSAIWWEDTIKWFQSFRSRPRSSDNWKPQPKEEGCDYITPNKKFFQWIYDRLVNVHKENPDVDYMLSFKRRIEELSFDKPSWKPSEEQMSMLLAVINDPNNAGSESCHLAMQSLYDDLKKL